MIPADGFLLNFASDRSHMRNPDGSWKMPPPPYPPIRTAGDTSAEWALPWRGPAGHVTPLICCRVPDEPGRLHQHGPRCGMGAGLQPQPLPSRLPERTRLRSGVGISVAAGSSHWAPMGVYTDHGRLILTAEKGNPAVIRCYVCL